MAEGRKLADELKKEQSVNAKKMKIGGVETEVTLKPNIGRSVENKISTGSGLNGSTRNQVNKKAPYLPFPISALPKEAVDQILPIKRDKRSSFMSFYGADKLLYKTQTKNILFSQSIELTAF